jgi:LytS/YehU family sensor histidine kinase
MMLGLIINGQDFLQQWKKSMQDNERMKTELLRSQHETLKSQVNPHFLFKHT